MFWVGILITLVSGFIGIGWSRDYLRRRFPDKPIDIFSICLLLAGVLITTAQYSSDQRESKAITEHLDSLNLKDIADYNAFGNKSGAWNGMQMVRTPLNDWCSSFVTRAHGTFNWTCSETSHEICQLALAKVPQFPFAHFFLAAGMKDRSDPRWRREALTSISILRKTTKVPGHHPDHDWFLKAAENLFTGT